MFRRNRSGGVWFASVALASLAALSLAPPAAADPPTWTSFVADISAIARTPSGMAVTWTDPTAIDDNGPPTIACAPPSGSTFTPGTTSVTCTATDVITLESVTQTFKVTITVDLPVITVPSDMTAPATGPSGATVTYTTSAVDGIDGPLPVDCGSWPSGSTFPLGTTTVTCSATDGDGNTVRASFNVSVVDMTPPTITAPDPITVRASGPDGAPATDPTIARFLAGSVASDNVSGYVKISSDAPPSFPIGTTKVTFRAVDGQGNAATATSSVTVVATAAPASAPRAVDTTPPDDVTAVTGALGSRSVILRWASPKAADFDHVEILRALDKSTAAPVVVYHGSDALFRDSGLRNGVAYRYLIVAVDHAGNRSIGIAVVATPGAPKLVRPLDGASVTGLPTLLWVPAHKATYYNVQVFRGSAKILSAWPGANSLKLGASWSYQGKTITLKPGTYHWFVWPGFGSRAARHYGPPLGGATFTVKAR